MALETASEPKNIRFFYPAIKKMLWTLQGKKCETEFFTLECRMY